MEQVLLLLQHSNPLWGVANTDRGIAATSWIWFISCISCWFSFEKSTQLPSPFCPQLPQLATGGSFPSTWPQPWLVAAQLDPVAFDTWRKLWKRRQSFSFWRSLWEPLHVGCSCWYSRESGKIVVNPPGHGGCFMPSPTGCWWGQPRAGRDTCSTGIVPFFGLAMGGERGGRAIKIRKETRGAAWEAFMEHGCGSAFLKPKISPLVCVLLCS